MQVFKRVKCSSPSCEKSYLVLVDKDGESKFEAPIIVCNTKSPCCKKKYEESLRPEIEVVE
jgi:hypothetical protein